MYIILATSTQKVPNAYYYPGADKIESEYHIQSVTEAFEVKTLDELTKFMVDKAESYKAVKYYEAKELFPEVVQTVKVNFK